LIAATSTQKKVRMILAKRGGINRRTVTQGELAQILDDLSDLSDRMFTELEIQYLAEMRKVVSRGKDITFSESKILLDIYRQKV